MKHCLIVDDSRVIRSIACGILASLGYEAAEAEDGAEALEACKTNMPDIVLFDMQMSNMSAVEFIRSLRRQSNGKHPFVLLCTTENDATRIAEALTAGADQYVMKPFDRDSVVAKLPRAANS